MWFQQYGEHRGKALALIYACLLLLMTACSGNPGQLVNSSTQPTQHVQGTPTSDSSYYDRGVAIQVPRQLSTPAAHRGTTVTPGQGHVPQGQGGIPSAFPHYFSFGAMNPPGSASQLDDMRSRNGAAFSFRYQYLTGGVNTGKGWEQWQQPSGQFATSYMQESAQHGYMPVFVYYEICLSNGPQPGSYLVNWVKSARILRQP